jgi:thymidylate synthase
MNRPLSEPRRPVIHPSAQSAWLQSLDAICASGDYVPPIEEVLSVGSAFGARARPSRELIAVTFGISDPRRRVISTSAYAPDLGYAIANTLWTLLGSDDLDMIGFYNPNGLEFSDDSRSVPSAPGKRIFHSDQGDQFGAALDHIRNDRSTRRAMIQVYLPQDTISRTRDCSCTGSMQLLVREDRLNCVVTMRSQSCARVMPYDLFLLTMLHECAAIALGTPIGTYYHFSGSLHFYEDEAPLVAKILASQSKDPVADRGMPPMASWSESVREALRAAEATVRLRLSMDPETPVPYESFGLDPYWTELLRTMVSGVRDSRYRRTTVSP